MAIADDPDVPADIEPISLLDVTAEPSANAYVLRQLQQPHSDRALQGALLAAVRKVRQGHFRSGEECAALIRSVAEIMAEPVIHPAVLPVAVQLSRSLARRAPQAAMLYRSLPATATAQRIWSDNRTTEPAARQEICRRLAAAAAARLIVEPDQHDEILPELIEEMLFSPNVDERLYSTMLIAATPYREPLGAAITAAAPGLLRYHQAPAGAVLRALTSLSVASHRQLVHDLLVDPGVSSQLAHAAAWATPHCAGQQDEKAWRRMLDLQLANWRRAPSQIGAGIVHGLTYGIGTDGHEKLLTEIRGAQLVPQPARAAAAWWLSALRPT
ncbi:MAG: hypothetical protein AUI10_10390 [Actinobacteria bacterium 13_2_20CM_2_72_6]|nr:MAG: hypothetical protein AUI10_10390 [Actinobacteria bacterium 13_2_20CM_2_72_6]